MYCYVLSVLTLFASTLMSVAIECSFNGRTLICPHSTEPSVNSQPRDGNTISHENADITSQSSSSFLYSFCVTISISLVVVTCCLMLFLCIVPRLGPYIPNYLFHSLMRAHCRIMRCLLYCLYYTSCLFTTPRARAHVEEFELESVTATQAT